MKRKLYAWLILAFAFGINNIYASVDVETGVDYSIQFDDNINSSKQDKKSDFINKITVEADIKNEGKTHAFNGTVLLTENAFVNNQQFNNFQQIVNLSLLKEFSKYSRLNLYNDFLHSEDPIDFESAFGKTNGNFNYFKNSFELNYSKDFSGNITSGFRYINQIYDVNKDQLKDSLMNTTELYLEYLKSSKTKFKFSTSYSKRNFDLGQNLDKYELAASVKQNISENMFYEIKTGLNILDEISGKNYYEPLFAFTLTQHIDQNTNARLTLIKEHDINPYLDDVFDSWKISFNVDRQLLKRLALESEIFIGSGRYISSDIKDQIKGLKFGFKYELKKYLYANIGYSFRQNASSSDTRDYVKNILYFGLSMRF